jgi:hypothetical protein
MDCKICRGPEGEFYRAQWGCDTPAAEPTLLDSCWSCDGSDPDCPTCSGSSRARLFECPNKVATTTAAEICFHANLFSAMSPVLPAAGGTLDQAAVFLDGLYYAMGQQSALTSKD